MAVGSKREKKLDIQNIKKIRKYFYIFLLLLIIVVIIYLIIPKIELKGLEEVKITYNEIYNDPGVKATLLFKDITHLVNVSNGVDNSKVGQYEIVYALNYKYVTLFKKRIVDVIDNVEPVINTDGDAIKVCPGKEIHEFDYSAMDEYDGDLTDKVIKEVSDDYITLTVSDNANNITKKELLIDRNDTEEPMITLKGNTTMYLNVGSRYSEPGYSAIDNCDGDITDKVIVSGSVGNSYGTYKINYAVTDNNGNKKETTRTVIVKNNYLYNDGSAINGGIYLTFDDGPNYGTTNVILDILKEEGVKATFFVTCGGSDDLIKRIYNEGHTLALHTCSHDYYTIYASVNNYLNDLERVSNRVKNLTGYESKIFRFPGGSSNTVSRITPGIVSTLAATLLDMGYRYYDWNVDSHDAGGANNSTQVYNNVVNSLRHDRANMVLMHDIKWQTRDALRNIIHYGKENGYSFEQIDMSTYMIRHSIAN